MKPLCVVRLGRQGVKRKKSKENWCCIKDVEEDLNTDDESVSAACELDSPIDLPMK